VDITDRQRTRPMSVAEICLTVATLAPFALGLILLLLSFAISLRLSSLGFPTDLSSGIALAVGALLTLLGALVIAFTALGRTVRFAQGMGATAFGAAGLALYPWFIEIFVIPKYEDARSACWLLIQDATNSQTLLEVTSSLIPVQVRCVTEREPSASLFSGLESFVMSSPFVVLAGLVVLGVYLMATSRPSHVGAGVQSPV
jgi:hypothetical protein